MAIENSVSINFDPRSAIGDSVFDCRLPGVSLVRPYSSYAPAIYNGGHIASPLSVHPYVRTSRTPCPVRTKNGFRAISFEYIGVLDSYFIHRYISIKYRSSSIKDTIHRL